MGNWLALFLDDMIKIILYFFSEKLLLYLFFLGAVLDNCYTYISSVKFSFSFLILK